MKKYTLCFVIAVILTITHGATADPAGKRRKAPPLNLATVTQGPFTIELQFDGTLVPVATFDVKITPEAYKGKLIVKGAPTEAGERVKQGQVLLALDPQELQEQLQELELDRQEARAQYAKLEQEFKLYEDHTAAKLAQAREAQDAAEERLRLFKTVDREMLVAIRKLNIKWNEFYIQMMQDELDQLRKMYQEDDLTEETEELVVKRTRRRLELSREALAFTQKRTEIFIKYNLPRELKRLTLDLNTHTITLKKLETLAAVEKTLQQLKLRKAKLKLAKLDKQYRELQGDLERLAVKAPADGILYYGSFQDTKWTKSDKVKATLQNGAAIPAKQTLYTVVGDKMVVHFDLKEDHRYLIAAGNGASVTPVGFPMVDLPAKITWIDRVCDAKGMYDVRLTLAQNDSRLTPGMSVWVLMSLERPQALTVPANAIFKDGALHYCKVFAQGKTTKRIVRVGLTREGRTEVLAGLQVGEQVLQAVKKRKGKK